MREAKRNLVREYLLVGVTEDIPSFISILEFSLPEFFKGASEHYSSSKFILIQHKKNKPILQYCSRSNNVIVIQGRRKFLRKTNKKIEPSEETVAEIKKSKIWQMENDLYEFALQQFQFVKNHMKITENGTVIDKGIQFKFEKIYPK